MTTPPPARAGRREWTALGVLMLPLLLVSMDVSVLYFAVPAINADIAPTGTEQLWIFDIYAFVLAGLLMTMGSLGDRIGRRRLLLFGAAAFGAASLAAAYADSPEMLIAARALLGIGGATLMPSTIALVRTMFTDPRQRAQAVGLWSAVMTGGVALGSVLSGLLVEYFWWGSVFLVNLPAMALLLVLGPLLLPESRDPAPGRFDLLSVPLSMAAVLPLIHGLKEFASDGPRPEQGLYVGAGLLFGVLFVWRQRAAASPMVPRGLFRSPGFAPAVVLNGVSALGMMGSALFTTQYLQSVLGMSALEAALWSLVPSLPIGVAAPTATALVQKGVPRAHVVTAGFVIAAGGYALLAVPDTDSLALVLVAAGVLASGIVLVMSQMADLALSAAPVEKAGSASSLLETGAEFGGALGMAVLGSVGAAVYRDAMPSAAPEAARETLGGALAVAAELPGRAGEALALTARSAFTDGMHAAGLTGAAVLAVAALAAATTLRRIRPATCAPPTAACGSVPSTAPGPGSVPDAAARP
jgi:DHA2 family multidrug resistance protein-like MFS transporter